MKIAVTSVAGPPDDPRTWSNAPAHLISALEARGHTCVPIDSSCLTRLTKVLMATGNAARGFPVNAVGWFEPARRLRARHVAETARNAGCDLVLCTGTLDVPVGHEIEYAVWLDNTFALLQSGATARPYPTSAIREIERLERTALNGARMVLPFSEHVGQSVMTDYCVPPQRVSVVGCGSGQLRPFHGTKDFQKGHLLFVAKHLFSAKGGDLLLDAFPLIRSERPGTKLVLIGNDEARKKAAGIDGVEVHGFVERQFLDRCFHDAAMLVQPMLADPWGQVYLEAMRARAVVVSLDVAAVPELTDDGRLGVLVDTPNPRTLANAVLATFARPQAELDGLTHRARERAIRLYSWQAVGERVAASLRLERQRLAATA